MILLQLNYDCEKLTKKTGKECSILRSKMASHMNKFEWEAILKEMKDRVPDLLNVLVTTTVPVHRESVNLSKCGIARIYPLCTVYGIMMQQRNRELSLLQRMNTMLMSAGKVDSKTYERFNRMGISLSHQQQLNILEEIGGRYQDDIINKVSQGEKFQITGVVQAGFFKGCWYL
ncbi:uncharacterized protein [Ptychodera flava]|uniref:uncharacterized protein n=1 Tax=Ptychodera flava TaxID=63121 RepID=UPI00396A9337